MGVGLGLGCCTEGRMVEPMDGRENEEEGDGKTVERLGEAVLAVAVVRTGSFPIVSGGTTTCHSQSTTPV